MFAVLALAACAGRLPMPGRLSPVEESTTTFESQGRAIRVDLYLPEGKGQRHPAAIVLHGSGGLHMLSTESSERYAEALANRGIAAYVVHYFDASGTFIANIATEEREYWRWVRVVNDAVAWVRRRPEVRRGRVGLFGFSMGAYLAVGAASTNPDISRVVLVSAGLERGVADSIRQFPPALVLHGMDDDVVTIAEEDTLLQALSRHRATLLTHRYPGEGHDFSDSAAVDAVERAARFLAEGRMATMLEVLRQSNTRRPADTTRARIP
jgi:dienelactone hydrolase